MLRTTMSTFLLLGVEACTITPYEGQTFSWGVPIFVSGYTDSGSTPVTVEAFDFRTNGWTQVGAAVSTATPTYPVGAYGDSPALFYWSTSVVLADPASEHSDLAQGDPRSWSARIRARNLFTGTNLVGGDSESLGCFLGDIPYTGTFLPTALDCGFSRTEIGIGGYIVF